MDIVEIEEPCSHSVQFGGMCANCGKDMTESGLPRRKDICMSTKMADSLSRSSYVTETLDASRATINMVHNNVSLTISQDEATRVEGEAKRRLLALRKLSLVVDLDQTIIHATVDPTVADWQKDEDNPNHDAVKDVRAFLLKDDGQSKAGCWYYIKLRPGLQQFLENVSKIYELHIYTMGTRAYAKNIADIVDPEHKIFGDRILSRDESGSLTAKSLQRLFPVDTKMVVIIDDRGDVWKWSPNLIKVTPYDFFVGIGDINSSFLPQKPSVQSSPKVAAMAIPRPNEDLAEGATKQEPEPSTNGAGKDHHEDSASEGSESPVDTNASPLEQLVAMGGGDDSITRQVQENLKEEAVAAQLEERPLLQKQKQLEADDAAADAAAESATKEDGEDSKPPSEDSSDSDKPRHNLLHDNDRELYHLEESLRSVHSAFFDAYTQQLAAAQGGRLGQLRGGQKRKLSPQTSDLDLVPDIKTIMPAVKARVLDGTVIVFSSLIPLGVDIEMSEVGILSMAFGAQINQDITRSTTHVVAAKNRTVKVRKAIKRGKGRIKVVSPQWLYNSIISWRKMDETPYLLDTEDSKFGMVNDDDDILSESESQFESLSEDTEFDANGPSKKRAPRLKLTTKARRPNTDDYESDLEGVVPSELDVDEKSPVGGTNEDWSAMNDELADFLASDADESDGGDSVASSQSEAGSTLSLRGKKRGRDDLESGGESDSGKKSKKKQTTTNLSQSTIADDESDILPLRTNDFDAPAEEKANGDEDEEEHEEGEGWSEFGEDDLEAELEKAASEERGEG